MADCRNPTALRHYTCDELREIEHWTASDGGFQRAQRLRSMRDIAATASEGVVYAPAQVAVVRCPRTGAVRRISVDGQHRIGGHILAGLGMDVQEVHCDEATARSLFLLHNTYARRLRPTERADASRNPASDAYRWLCEAFGLTKTQAHNFLRGLGSADYVRHEADGLSTEERARIGAALGALVRDKDFAGAGTKAKTLAAKSLSHNQVMCALGRLCRTWTPANLAKGMRAVLSNKGNLFGRQSARFYHKKLAGDSSGCAKDLEAWMLAQLFQPGQDAT